MALQRGLIDMQLCRLETNHRDATALAIAAIVHLLGGSQNVATSDGNIRGKSKHTAATLGSLWRSLCAQGRLE
jgi:hypothetical protein